jgi:hypothetical protein
VKVEAISVDFERKYYERFGNVSDGLYFSVRIATAACVFVFISRDAHYVRARLSLRHIELLCTSTGGAIREISVFEPLLLLLLLLLFLSTVSDHVETGRPPPPPPPPPIPPSTNHPLSHPSLFIETFVAERKQVHAHIMI